MKRIAIMSTFFEATSGYSLIGVAETQIRMLLDHGYEPVVLVQDNFTSPPSPTLWSETMIDLRKCLPFMHLRTDVAPDFEERVSKIEAALAEHLADVNVCITHDIMLQDFYKEHNAAVRRYAKSRPDLLWLHWLHSCPSPSNEAQYPNALRYISPPGFLVYPNSTDLSRVCQTYHLGGQEWRAKACRAGHAIDPLRVWHYDPLTVDLATRARLLSGEVVAVYPARLDRGKQPEKIIYLMAGVKEAGYEPRLLVIDWQSAGQRFQQYIDELLALSESLGLGDCVSFTSRLDDRCSQGVPRHVVVELMDLSNTYIHPSRVETYSLVVHEAALRGKLLCLNHDLPPMRELFGDNSIFFDFESDRFSRRYEPDERIFWQGEAKRLIAELKQNRALWAQTVARREWTPEAMWKEFETLFFLESVGE
ncbi:MAG: hypothetical protein A2W25_11965 [candidate division Zixibacteria bacterium RBG_16_53_22]|nr:MAG: hypothetical protein A2W25_11965 [candidate division Zixibacteria bacterium RBG_16_53_22]